MTFRKSAVTKVDTGEVNTVGPLRGMRLRPKKSPRGPVVRADGSGEGRDDPMPFRGRQSGTVWDSTALARFSLAVVFAASAVLSFRGWHPHDEGTLGLAASSVLRGEIPHVDFYDMYSGLQAYIHGGAFSIMGESIRTLRIVGVVIAGLIGLMSYRILRRRLQVVPAALIASSTLVFGYLAYPSSMPTWWNVAFGLVAADRLLLYWETGSHRCAAWAGFFVGLGILIKSTGLYVMFALLLWMLSWGRRRIERQLYLVTAAVSFLFLGMIVARTLSTGTVVLVLVPWSVLCLLGWHWIGRRAEPRHQMSEVPTAVGVFVATAALPVILFALPYLISGNFNALWKGWVTYPSLRFESASAPIQFQSQALLVLLLGVAVAVVASRLLPLRAVALVGAGAAGAYSLLNWAGFWNVAITAVEYSTLALVLFLGIAHFRRGSILPESWLAGCLLASGAFVQIPLWGPVYTMYVGPLAILAAALCLASVVDLKWFTVALFSIAMAAGVQMGSGKLYLATPDDGRAGAIALTMDRGGIRSPANYAFYNDLIEYLERYEGTPLYAGPDSPEVYFLAGALNPSGVFFEVLVPDWDPNSLPLFLEQHQIEAVVLKGDRIQFSEAVPPEIVAEIEKAYPHVTRIGWFLVYEKEARV